MTELLYFGDRNEAGSYLADHGWQVSSRGVGELFAAHGLPPLQEGDGPGFGGLSYISAIRG